MFYLYTTIVFDPMCKYYNFVESIQSIYIVNVYLKFSLINASNNWFLVCKIIINFLTLKLLLNRISYLENHAE